MAVLFVTELPGRSSDQRIASGRIAHSYTRLFQVLFSTKHNIASMPVDVRIAIDPNSGLSVPLAGHRHPADPFTYVMHVAALQPQKDQPRLWTVSVTYESVDALEARDVRAPSINPLSMAPNIELISSRQTRHVDEDKDGKAIVNANGEYYREGTERDFSDRALAVTKNLALPNLPALLDLDEPINDTAFTISIGGMSAMRVAKYAGKLTNFRATLQRSSGLVYWQFSFELHIRRKGWIKRILHRGTRERILQGQPKIDKVVQALDDDGEPVQKEILLAENGERLKDGEEPFFQTVRIYDELDFTAIGL